MSKSGTRKRPARRDGYAAALLLDSSPFPAWLYDETSLRILAVNKKALHLYGYAEEQFLALRVSDLQASDPGDPSDPAQGLAKVRHRKSDGSLITLRIETSRIAFDGRAACLAAAIDLTAEERTLADRERRCRQLEKSEERYRQLFEVASDWFWETDVENRITFLSANVAVVLGLPASAYIGKRLSETEGVVIDPEAARASLAAIKSRQPYRDFLYSRKLPDGKVLYVSTAGAPFFGEDGTFRGYRGTSRDVTAQVEAERARREEEQRFREVLEASADFYWQNDAQYRYVHISPGFERLLGIPVAEMIGKRLTDIPGVSIENEMGRMVLRQQAAKQPYRDFVYARTTPDGRKRWFKSSAAPLLDRDGKFTGFLGVSAEITQNVEAEAMARLRQQRLQEAVAHMTQPIAVFDAEHRIAAFNQVFWEEHRIPNGDYARIGEGTPYREIAEWELSHGLYASAPGEAALDIDTLLARYGTEQEHSYQLRDGRWMMVLHRALPGGGRLGLWTDITAIKRAEAERRALEAQVQHAERLKSLGTLAGGAAHEINNALVPAIALTKLVAAKLPEGSRERRNLDLAVTGAERSRDLVKQILAFSRHEQDEQQRQSVDLGAVLRQALGLMRATLPSTIRLEEQIAPTAPIAGDPGQLQQLIVNIMTNAAHAIGQAQGGIVVNLGAEAGGTHLRLSIADTGCGMDEATKARIFEPFFTTKPVGEGTGLGLSVVHGIVKAHGGRIEVESAPGRGSRFDVVLPIECAGTEQAA